MRILPYLTTTLAASTSFLAVSGSIDSPNSGGIIMPGQAFDFSYNSMADKGISSYNFTVWVFTNRPGPFESSENWAMAHYLGRFGLLNEPGSYAIAFRWHALGLTSVIQAIGIHPTHLPVS
jgi:hypothetical protein